MSADFCDAEHPNAKDGCYGTEYHDGKHWAYSNSVHDTTGETQNRNGNFIWEWDGEDTPAEAPVGSAALVLTDNEIAVMLASLVSLEQVIPGLAKPIINKLTAARESLKQ